MYTRCAEIQLLSLYREICLQNKSKASTAESAAGSSTSNTTTVVQDLVAQQLQGSNMAVTDDKLKHQQALLAAVDKALLQMKVDVLDRCGGI